LDDTSNNNDTTLYRSNHLSLTLPGQKQQPFGYVRDDPYTAVLLEESEKLYEKLTTRLTNEAMAAAAAAIKESSLSLPITNNRKNYTYKIEEPRYNNQSQTYRVPLQ
jgi:hypothetical protein